MYVTETGVTYLQHVLYVNELVFRRWLRHVQRHVKVKLLGRLLAYFEEGARPVRDNRHALLCFVDFDEYQIH